MKKNEKLFETTMTQINEIMFNQNFGSGPTTETRGFDILEYNSEDDADMAETDRHNYLIEQLACACDLIYIGNGIWYTHFNNDCKDAQDECRELIQNFIENYEW